MPEKNVATMPEKNVATMPEKNVATMPEKNVATSARDLVKVYLPLDRHRKEKGKYVSVNTHRYFIPYGEECEVPRFIAEVLQRSIREDEKTARRIMALAQEASKF